MLAEERGWSGVSRGAAGGGGGLQVEGVEVVVGRREMGRGGEGGGRARDLVPVGSWALPRA